MAEQVRIVFTLDPTTGVLGVEGPDPVENRAVYDFILSEFRRRQDKLCMDRAGEAHVSSILRPGGGLHLTG